MTSDAPSQKSGVFITLEGGEGTGKSTQIKRLSERLSNHGVHVITTREPGGAPGAEEIRKLLVNGPVDRWNAMSEALLNSAARSEHLNHKIRPALNKGTWVISDRFSDSTLAYQGYAGGVELNQVKALNDIVLGDTVPDLTLILDLSVEEGLKRASDRGDEENRFEQKGDAYHERLRLAFLEIAKTDPKRYVVVDAAQSIEDLSEEIWDVVSDRFDLGRKGRP